MHTDCNRRHYASDADLGFLRPRIASSSGRAVCAVPTRPCAVALSGTEVPAGQRYRRRGPTGAVPLAETQIETDSSIPLYRHTVQVPCISVTLRARRGARYGTGSEPWTAFNLCPFEVSVGQERTEIDDIPNENQAFLQRDDVRRRPAGRGILVALRQPTVCRCDAQSDQQFTDCDRIGAHRARTERASGTDGDPGIGAVSGQRDSAARCRQGRRAVRSSSGAVCRHPSRAPRRDHRRCRARHPGSGRSPRADRDRHLGRVSRGDGDHPPPRHVGGAQRAARPGARRAVDRGDSHGRGGPTHRRCAGRRFRLALDVPGRIFRPRSSPCC